MTDCSTRGQKQQTTLKYIVNTIYTEACFYMDNNDIKGIDVWIAKDDKGGIENIDLIFIHHVYIVYALKNSNMLHMYVYIRVFQVLQINNVVLFFSKSYALYAYSI